MGSGNFDGFIKPYNNLTGIKAQRLTWTQQWRRRNKKGKTDLAVKKKTRRAAKVVKAIQGHHAFSLSLPC